MSKFELHPRLAADTFPVGDLPLSRVLLMNDTRYPWVILVPRRAGVREIHELRQEDRVQLLDECCRVSELIQRTFACQKLNLGALGNLVPQLHLHLIARSACDPAWPGPVWGHSPAKLYAATEADRLVGVLRKGLGLVDAAGAG